MKAAKAPRRPRRPRALRRRVLLALDLPLSTERRLGIIEYARESGWILDTRLMAFLIQGQHEQYLASARFDGVISMLSGQARVLFPFFEKLTVPVVELWYDFPQWPAPRVLLNHQAAGKLGAEHLTSLGLRSLLFYSHSVDRRSSLIRCAAFRETAERQGASVRELWWDPNLPIPSKGGRVGWLARQLQHLPKPLGVLAANDVTASEVIDAAEQGGLMIPDEVAVLGIDNDPILNELGPVPLSSIDIARQRVGYEAAALLDRLMAGQRAPTEPVLVDPAGVVTRRSTEVIAIKDPDIARALHFIRQHFRDPITVADVAANTFLSRRRLQDRFRVALGHGMNDEITRQRLDYSKHLLVTTGQKISRIATLAGFTSVQHMAKVYSRVLATTPQTYRRRYQTPGLHHHVGHVDQKVSS